MIKTVEDLINELNLLPYDLPIFMEKYDFCWSGDLNDTDLSDWVLAKIEGIEVQQLAVPFEKDDPRRNDKRRTCFATSQDCVVIKVQK